MSGGWDEIGLPALYDSRCTFAGQLSESGPANVHHGQRKYGVNAGSIDRAGPGDLEQDFRAAISVLTEHACREGLELDVLEALFPLFMPGIGDDDGEDRPL